MGWKKRTFWLHSALSTLIAPKLPTHHYYCSMMIASPNADNSHNANARYRREKTTLVIITHTVAATVRTNIESRISQWLVDG